MKNQRKKAMRVSLLEPQKTNTFAHLTFVCVIRYQEELPALISSRSDKHMNLSELVKLMEWKLTVSRHHKWKHEWNFLTIFLFWVPLLQTYVIEKILNVTSSVSLEWFSGFYVQRGKFRPRLQQLVASNSEDTVEKCSSKAFSLLPDVQAAISELSLLKGVGPATASGWHTISFFVYEYNCSQ